MLVFRRWYTTHKKNIERYCSANCGAWTYRKYKSFKRTNVRMLLSLSLCLFHACTMKIFVNLKSELHCLDLLRSCFIFINVMNLKTVTLCSSTLITVVLVHTKISVDLLNTTNPRMVFVVGFKFSWSSLIAKSQTDSSN